MAKLLKTMPAVCLSIETQLTDANELLNVYGLLHILISQKKQPGKPFLIFASSTQSILHTAPGNLIVSEDIISIHTDIGNYTFKILSNPEHSTILQ